MKWFDKINTLGCCSVLFCHVNSTIEESQCPAKMRLEKQGLFQIIPKTHLFSTEYAEVFEEADYTFGNRLLCLQAVGAFEEAGKE